MSETATKNPPTKPAKKEKGEYVDPLALKGKGRPEKVATKAIKVYEDLQVRTTVDAGSDVDEGRAQGIAEAFKDPEKAKKIAPVKIVKVAPEVDGGKPSYILFDGHHTRRGAAIAKVEEIDALVWDGTPPQALHAAATIANREHEANGAPLTSKDKARSVLLLANSYKKSDIPKKDWPSYRQLATKAGCSHQYVNLRDPFGRGKGDKSKETAAIDKAKRDAAKAAGAAAGVGSGVVNLDPAKKSPARFTIVDPKTLSPLAHYDEPSAEKACDRFRKEHPAKSEGEAQKIVAVETKPTATPSANGTPNGTPQATKPVGFDWAGMDAHTGYLARGMEGMKDLFDCKKCPEYDTARDHLGKFALSLKALREKFGSKKK